MSHFESGGSVWQFLNDNNYVHFCRAKADIWKLPRYSRIESCQAAEGLDIL